MSFLPVSFGIKIKVIKTTCKAVHHLAPGHLSDAIPAILLLANYSSHTVHTGHVPAPGPLHQLFPLLGIFFPKISLGLIYPLASRFWFKYYIVNETSLTTIFKMADFSTLIPLSLIYIFLPPIIYNMIYLFNTCIVYYCLSLLKCKLHISMDRALSVFLFTDVS